MADRKPTHRGKVRDIYDLGDTLALVATDRVSVFDVVLNQLVPDKGKVLTQMTRFWLTEFFQNVPSHFLSVHPDDVRAAIPDVPDALGRTMLVCKADILPIESIVRGRITGSGWKDYKRTGVVCGHRLPAGLQESQELPVSLYTPSTKADIGEHDENIDFAKAVEIVDRRWQGQGRRLMSASQELALMLFDEAAAYAASRGIVLADTKFEFGLDSRGQLLVCDEVLTPDSSRFWPADQIVLGQTPPSFDKQPLRDWAEALGWDKKPPAPDMPEEAIAATTERYREALVRLTDRTLEEWLAA